MESSTRRNLSTTPAQVRTTAYASSRTTESTSPATNVATPGLSRTPLGSRSAAGTGNPSSARKFAVTRGRQSICLRPHLPRARQNARETEIKRAGATASDARSAALDSGFTWPRIRVMGSSRSPAGPRRGGTLTLRSEELGPVGNSSRGTLPMVELQAVGTMTPSSTLVRLLLVLSRWAKERPEIL